MSDGPRFVELIRQMRIGVSSEAAAELFTMLDRSWGLQWCGKSLRLANTPNWNTPLNFYQQAIIRDSFHNWRTGDCLGCVLGVCCNFLGKSVPDRCGGQFLVLVTFEFFFVGI